MRTITTDRPLSALFQFFSTKALNDHEHLKLTPNFPSRLMEDNYQSFAVVAKQLLYKIADVSILKGHNVTVLTKCPEI